MGSVSGVDAMDQAELRLNDIFEAHDEHRRRTARLPFEEKIKILVRMQKRAAEMRPDLNRTVWQIEGELPES